MVLPHEFYEKDTVQVAKDLLGCYLIHTFNGEKAGGKIVETEAYLGDLDPASHSYKGINKRNATMFGPPGHAYIYLIYGIHYCFNIVTRPEGIGEAVLVRALEPTIGIPFMIKQRHTENSMLLCNGPAKLTQALRITKDLNGSDLVKGPLTILSQDTYEKKNQNRPIEIISSARIGISQGKEYPFRLYIKGSQFISRL